MVPTAIAVDCVDSGVEPNEKHANAMLYVKPIKLLQPPAVEATAV